MLLSNGPEPTPISQKQESSGVKFSLVCYRFKEVMEQGPQYFLTCRQEALEKAKAAKFQETAQDLISAIAEPKGEPEGTGNYSELYKKAAAFPASLQTHMDSELKENWVKAYETSRSFRQAWEDP